MSSSSTSSTVPYIFVIFLLIVSQSQRINCIPQSPCPVQFSYLYDNQWFGIGRIHPQIYDRLRTERIRLNISLVINRHIPNIQNLRLLDLYHPLAETLRDIAAHKPILYRVNFPFQDVIPSVLRMYVNGIPICINQNVLFGVSKIELQYTFYLPTIHDEPPIDYYDSGLDFNADADADVLDPNKPLHEQPIVPSVVQHRGDMDHHGTDDPQKNIGFLSSDTTCGTYDNEFKYTHLMTGGEKIVAGTWPWLVAIFRKETIASNLAFLCTGSLLTNRIVVTAAHCFQMNALQQIATNEIVLSFGRHDIRDWADKNMRMSNVQEIHVHPDYLKRRRLNLFDADIAVVVAKDIIDFNAMIRPICLWPAKIDASVDIIGSNGTLVGWGQPFENTESNTPRRLNLPIVSPENCFPSGRVRGNHRIFCAGSGMRGRAPCNGDSGSGLAMWVNGAWYLRGVVSAALGDPILNKCDLNTFVIFTDILLFREWIDTFISVFI